MILLICVTSLSANALNEGDKIVDSRDGNVYTTLKIGNQVWMAENMRYAGNIPLGDSKNINKPFRYYPNGKSENVASYGYLYNWNAAKIVCPSGWHLPTNAEWKELKNALGSESVGSKLATEANIWTNGALERTSAFGKSGFKALPAGNFDENYSNFGSFTYFWTDTEYEYYNGNAYFMYIYYNYNGIVSNYSSKDSGFSVRCVKDE